jgi:tetratricopeptide (TPR) repeat protein
MLRSLAGRSQSHMNHSDARNSRPICAHSLAAAPLSFLHISAICAVLLCALPASAGEQAEQFLRGLQSRGLNELAIDYLDRMKTSQLVDDEFRRQIPYHRGVALIEQSRQTIDTAARSRLLDEARAALESYAAENPQNVQGAEAQLQLASVQLSQGQQLVAQAGQLPAEASYDAQRQAIGQDARVELASARETFTEAESIYNSELEKLPPTSIADAKDDDSSGNRRQEYRARVAQLRFLAAQTQFEIAQTYSPQSDDFRKQHEAAAQELAAIYDEFARTFIVGLYARLYEGRSYQAIGQSQQALGCYEDVLAQPNVLPPFRKLIASAVHRKAELLISQDKYDAAIETADTCLRDAKSAEETLPEWLAVRYRLAEAIQKKAASQPKGSLDQRKLLGEAREAYRLVAAAPGEFQGAARTAAASLVPAGAGERKAPQNFQSAYDAGKDALASYNAAKLAVPSAERNNPAALTELQEQMNQGKLDARYYFRAATTLVEDDTDIKLLNEVRYFLCWLYWESEDYYQAAVLGEFLARRYPDHPAAGSAAKISMAAYERLYSQAAAGGKSNNDTEFEARRMAQMAEFIARRWPGTEDANAARSVLVSYAIRTNRIDEAEKLLGSTPAESRPQLELQLGNAMWARYLELANSPAETRPPDATLAEIKNSATKYLTSGFDAVRKDRNATDATAATGLYLVQAYLSDEDYAKAIELLEDPRVGSLAIASRQSTAISPQFAVEAYKAALRAYVLATPPQVQKALDAMQSLEQAAKKSGADEAQLTQIYIGLGVALEKQLKQLRSSGRDADATRISAAFAEFLEKIAERQSGANWPTRVWLAQTYYSMSGADSDSSDVPRLTESDRRYLQKAREAYQQLIAEAAKDPKFAPTETSVLAAKMHLGETYKALGQYQEALDTFSDILKDKESSLSVQRAAAQAYQQRGQKENAQWFERAIHGGYKLRSTGQNRIWGWLKISQVAARAARADEKYRDAFFEARINIARCRYQAAIKQDGAARKRDLAKAKQGIHSLAQLYPNLGGEKWRSQFDIILKEIQSAAGEQPSGLSEFSTVRQPAS